MQNTPVPVQTPPEQEDIDRNKDVAAISYLWILSVAVLYARRESPFVQYHARQGVWLFLISIVAVVLDWFMPMVGRGIGFLVLAGMIIGFINAAQGKKHDVPIVGQLAKGTLTIGDVWKMCLDGFRRAFSAVRKGVSPKQEQQNSAEPFQTPLQSVSPRDDAPSSTKDQQV